MKFYAKYTLHRRKQHESSSLSLNTLIARNVVCFYIIESFKEELNFSHAINSGTTLFLVSN